MGDSSEGQCHLLPVASCRVPVWCYKMFYSLWLPLWGLGVHGRGLPVHTDEFLPTPSSRSKSAKGTKGSPRSTSVEWGHSTTVSGHTKVSCHVPSAHRPLWWCSQGVIRVRPAEFIRPKQTKIWPFEGRVFHRNSDAGWAFKGIMAPLKNHTTQCFPGSSQISLTAGPG